MKPRPNSLTPEIAEKVARKLVERMVKNDDLQVGQAEQAIRVIVKVGRRHMDRYELARALEQRCYWDCDFAIAEALDDFAHLASREIDIAQRAWAQAEKPEPPLPVGSKVIVRDAVGSIAGIYEHGAAQYKVRVDTDPPNSHRIINFEDAVAA